MWRGEWKKYILTQAQKCKYYTIVLRSSGLNMNGNVTKNGHLKRDNEHNSEQISKRLCTMEKRCFDEVDLLNIQYKKRERNML
uniref:Uncharacterized protein n=1 Tax=Lepeophtheirus salmonis TaxID=72036 RepID=A0A0K2V8B1_LEPSM